MPGGIYKITNTVSNKCYIGSAKNFEQRWERHLCDLSAGLHRNTHLQRSFNKYGNVFDFDIIETLDWDQKFYFEREDHWMKVFDSQNRTKGYNIANASGGGHKVPHSEEAKTKISKSLLENHPTRGIALTDEHKRKISESNMGKLLSDETKAKISESLKGENNPRFGKQLSDETKAKISESLKGENHWNYGKTTSINQSEAARANWTGENNPRATKIVIDGVVYKTQKEAYTALNITRKTVSYRLHSPKWPTWTYYSE